MKFTKMHGCGNDYVYINCFESKVENASKLAIAMSHRHFGIGSDGLVLIQSHNSADAEMVMYNSDGSMSEMCGNALRCVAKFIYDHNICKKNEMTLMTGAGIKKATIFADKNDIAQIVTVNMSAPILDGLRIPTDLDQEQIIDQEYDFGDFKYNISCISMGNPHCVIFVDDVDNFPVEKFGSIIENHKLFPNKTNVEFVEIISRTEVKQRTWERGAGETWACGTGASAVCVAGVLSGKTSEKLLIHLLGGDLELEYSKGQSVMLTGPATEVFTGNFPV